MACSYPITIRDKLRGTDITPKMILVPCGKCINCIQRKRAEWSFRLLQELKISQKSTFLTLTYNENSIPKNNKLEKKILQNYFKRVRVTERDLKYYAVGEYGTKTLRPHYHAIVFGCDNNTLVDQWHNTESSNKDVLGFVTCDTVTEASIHYVTGYVISKYGKIDEKRVNPLIFGTVGILPLSPSCLKDWEKYILSITPNSINRTLLQKQQRKEDKNN